MRLSSIIHFFIYSIFLLSSFSTVYAAETQPMVKNKSFSSLTPPRAEKIPHLIQQNGQQWTDNYFWLRDPKWPKVEDPKILDYLNKENEYSAAFMKENQAQYDQLYREIIGRIKLKDSSVPIKIDNYYYYKRTEEDSNHAIYCRKKGSLDAPEEILLDGNALAKNSAYLQIDETEVDNAHQKLAYSADTTGEDRYTIKVKDLSTGNLLKDTVENTLGPLVWHKNNSGFFYAKLSDQWRAEEIYFHRLNTQQSEDVLIYKEPDPLFMNQVYRSGSKRFLFIVTQSKNATEIRYIDMDQDDLNPKLIQARQEEHLYYPDHHDNLFYILTNDKGKNFRLVTAPITAPEQKNWQEYIAHNPSVYLSDFEMYQNHMVLSTKENGLKHIKIITLANKSEKDIPFPDPTYEASQQFTTFDAKGVRIVYSSLVTPPSVLEFDFDTHRLNTLKVTEIPSGYDKSAYVSERVFATGKDGTKIPISLVYKKSLFKKDGSNPLYLYGYGAYGMAMPASFRHHSLTLIDRGFVYAIAHVRGGDEMGYEWYEDGKLLKKKNSFEDFISIAEYLAQNKYTSAGKMTISGGSAGGLLIGAVLNQSPNLYNVVVADVPFVDALNTMLDDTLPLTPGEFKEWGNPKDPVYFQYIKSYSPYDNLENLKSHPLPAIFVNAGINDPRVTYWEPAKWVAKLREFNTNNALILLHTNMEAGHAGASGRFGHMADITKEYLFILKQNQRL